MSDLWYPKQSPVLSLLGLGGGVGTKLAGGAALLNQVDVRATHFWDFSSSVASPFEDQRGSLEFTNNTGNMTVGDTSYGSPPGWSGGTGKFAAANSNLMSTDADACFDLSGNFCVDCCVYNTNAPASTSHMSWSQGKAGSSTWYVYNASGASRFDSANSNYSSRLGEAGSGSTPVHNYVQNKWCVVRLRRQGGTTHVKWWQENSAGNGWETAPGSPYSGGTNGTGPDGSSNGGFLALNGWTHNGSYDLANVAIAWMAYYTDGANDQVPYIPGEGLPLLYGPIDGGEYSGTVSNIETNDTSTYITAASTHIRFEMGQTIPASTTSYTIKAKWTSYVDDGSSADYRIETSNGSSFSTILDYSETKESENTSDFKEVEFKPTQDFTHVRFAYQGGGRVGRLYFLSVNGTVE